MSEPPGATHSLGTSPRILIVRLGAIGDVVNALIVANGLRRAIPGAVIGWAVHPLSRALVEGHPSVDRVHVWPKGTGVGGFRRVVREVREARYDLALDLQRLQKSALLARMSGAKRVLGFDRARSKEQSWLWTKERIETGHPREHMVRQYQRFLDLLGVPRAPLCRELVDDPESRAWAEARVAGDWAGAAPILLNIGASKLEKQWPEASFRALANELRKSVADAPIVITGGPSDVEMGQSLQRAIPGLHQLAGETSIPQLVALIRRARGIVTGDTGAMHMAAALDVPTVAIFGPSDPVRTGPFGAGHVVLQGDQVLSPRGSGAEERGNPAERVRCKMSETLPSTVSIQATRLFGVR